MVDYLDTFIFVAGAAFLIVARQGLKSATDWTVKQGIGWVTTSAVQEGVSRDEIKGNEQALEIEKRLRDKLERREEEISDYEWMLRSLKHDNISKKRIIEKYWRPLPAIIITFYNDYEGNKKEKKFLKYHIQENNEAEMLTANTYVIPPKGFPERFESPNKVGRDKIRDWIEEDILAKHDNGKVVICQASAVDLRRVYSHTDYETHSFNRKTIDQALDIDKILGENNVHRILASDGVNLSRAIEDGDIAFFLSHYVSDDELEIIHENQNEIRERLQDPSLRKIATSGFEDELTEVLSDYIDAPREAASKAIEEAKLWQKELQAR
ncbi:hypothetical protein NP511_01335 [Natrinema thermotolerans]|uniref:Uncharacterized protein n=1 Tax=Natrinema thermotolerans TaxID=121872 RepID=A0AAF0PGN2_9EURY|nr:hypothetical protein [Natrinema thermotolerans]WMT07661.1 hypothetical protein NP511_20050 [Natrinema thermotolerans]WMT08293.1 hypothetical protein NP511_01335 [Natrinema thermotolerans]